MRNNKECVLINAGSTSPLVTLRESFPLKHRNELMDSFARDKLSDVSWKRWENCVSDEDEH